PAREYYGQALLESGDREGAQAQLAYLKRLKADDLAKQLEDAIAAAPVPDKDKAAKTAGAGSGTGSQNNKARPESAPGHGCGYRRGGRKHSQGRGSTRSRGLSPARGPRLPHQRHRPRLAHVAGGEADEVAAAREHPSVPATVPAERVLPGGEHAVLDAGDESPGQIVGGE